MFALTLTNKRYLFTLARIVCYPYLTLALIVFKLYSSRGRKGTAQYTVTRYEHAADLQLYFRRPFGTSLLLLSNPTHTLYEPTLTFTNLPLPLHLPLLICTLAPIDFDPYPYPYRFYPYP